MYSVHQGSSLKCEQLQLNQQHNHLLFIQNNRPISSSYIIQDVVGQIHSEADRVSIAVKGDNKKELLEFFCLVYTLWELEWDG